MHKLKIKKSLKRMVLCRHMVWQQRPDGKVRCAECGLTRKLDSTDLYVHKGEIYRADGTKVADVPAEVIA